MLLVPASEPTKPLYTILTPAAGPVFVTLLLQNSVAIRDGQPTMQDEMRPREREWKWDWATDDDSWEYVTVLLVPAASAAARLLLLLHPPLHRASADAATVQLH